MTGVSLLGDHFSPILVPLSPVALLPGAAFWLIGVQALLVALSIPIVWLVARELSPGRAGVVTAVYAVCPPLLYAVWNDFHASTLALPFVAAWLLGVVKRNRGVTIWAGLAAVLCREDVALTVGVVGLFLALTVWRGTLGVALAGVVVSVSYFAAGGGTGWLSGAGLAYLRESAFPEVIGDVLQVSWSGGLLVSLLATLIVPWRLLGRQDLRLWAFYLVSVAPLLVLDAPNVHSPGLHYFSVGALIGPLALRTGETSRPGLLPRLVLLVLLVSGPMGTSLWTYSALANPPAPVVLKEGIETYGNNAEIHDLLASLGDEGLVVSAVQNLVPLISSRNQVYPWPAPFFDLVLGKISDVPIVVADPGLVPDLVLVPVREQGLFRPVMPDTFPAAFGYEVVLVKGDMVLLERRGE